MLSVLEIIFFLSAQCRTSMLSRILVSDFHYWTVLRHVVAGEGAFSTVYKVKRLSDGQEYALKKVRTNKIELSFLKSFMQLTESYKG